MFWNRCLWALLGKILLFYLSKIYVYTFFVIYFCSLSFLDIRYSMVLFTDLLDYSLCVRFFVDWYIVLYVKSIRFTNVFKIVLCSSRKDMSVSSNNIKYSVGNIRWLHNEQIFLLVQKRSNICISKCSSLNICKIKRTHFIVNNNKSSLMLYNFKSTKNFL